MHGNAYPAHPAIFYPGIETSFSLFNMFLSVRVWACLNWRLFVVVPLKSGEFP